MPTHFIRFGGCDYRCSWCDSLYAVTPALWRDAPRLAAWQIHAALKELGDGPKWVTLTGGNPAIHDLDQLVGTLHNHGYRITVETQGSKWRPWLTQVDHLTLSPKPPSSGMMKKHDASWHRFLDSCVRTQRYTPATSLKIVVFDREDLEWAAGVLEDGRARGWPLFISAGTNTPTHVQDVDGNVNLQGEFKLGGVPVPDFIVKADVLDRYRWICDQVKGDDRFRDVRVLPQLHVLAWGTMKGV